ncbi:ras-related protein rab-like protein-10 [Protomyces lactucae-debilis]|uniref:Ras-related protein rab-like protein-10 n=1 Tax=Protomyces lactucae-debilis TaxID=2754530 RepID=A0A1Y2FQQ1_PROLT|nr:ras-related protein rab-like protein-10 [Protomyces lactucae-debilis]ORY86308.1 ras-related protein rab-like protein-10 [Protomyces lactucae-debilis]
MSDIETIKLLLIGNSSAGKSSLLLRFTSDTYAEEDNQATIGVDFKTKLINFRGQKVKLTIWDTAGQERFRTLTSSYYRGCQGVLIVYDVTSRASFDQLPRWMAELDSHTAEQDVVTFVVGNKTDRQGRTVTREEGEALAKKLHADGYFEASAKDNVNVRSIFVSLTEEILKRRAEKPSPATASSTVRMDAGQADDSSCAC